MVLLIRNWTCFWKVKVLELYHLQAFSQVCIDRLQFICIDTLGIFVTTSKWWDDFCGIPLHNCNKWFFYHHTSDIDKKRLMCKYWLIFKIFQDFEFDFLSYHHEKYWRINIKIMEFGVDFFLLDRTHWLLLHNWRRFKSNCQFLFW